MPASFNLINQPWIPVEWNDGGTSEVSLLELFDRSSDISEIHGDLPTQSFAILRLALAILYSLDETPTNFAEWKKWWTQPALPFKALNEYLNQHRDRFDLLHPATPFYQVADLRTSKDDVKNLSGFISDVPTGNPQFAMRSSGNLEELSFAEAARWLVSCQSWDFSGIKSGAVGDPRVKGGRGYPIGVGWLGNLGALYVDGDNLRDTLLLNLLPLGEYAKTSEDDSPVWEREPQTAHPLDAKNQSEPTGVLDLYTWQSRRIRLHHDDEKVTGVLISQGDRLTGHNRHDVEPMTAWRRSAPQEKALKLPQVFMPQTHDPSRALWRGMATLLPSTAGRSTSKTERQNPKLTAWVSDLVRRKVVPNRSAVHLRAVGIEYGTQNAIVDEVFADSVTTAAAAFDTDHPELAVAIADSIDDADKAVFALRNLASNLRQAAGDRDGTDGARVNAGSDAYAALDPEFRRWLSLLGPDTDIDIARAAWQTRVYQIISGIGAHLVDSAGAIAWRGRDLDPGADNPRTINSPLAEIYFRRRLAKDLPLSLPTNQAETATA